MYISYCSLFVKVFMFCRFMPGVSILAFCSIFTTSGRRGTRLRRLWYLGLVVYKKILTILPKNSNNSSNYISIFFIFHFMGNSIFSVLTWQNSTWLLSVFSYYINNKKHNKKQQQHNTTTTQQHNKKHTAEILEKAFYNLCFLKWKLQKIYSKKLQN